MKTNYNVAWGDESVLHLETPKPRSKTRVSRHSAAISILKRRNDRKSNDNRSTTRLADMASHMGGAERWLRLPPCMEFGSGQRAVTAAVMGGLSLPVCGFTYNYWLKPQTGSERSTYHR